MKLHDNIYFIFLNHIPGFTFLLALKYVSVIINPSLERFLFPFQIFLQMNHNIDYPIFGILSVLRGLLQWCRNILCFRHS